MIAKPGQIWMHGWPGGENWGVSSQNAAFVGEYGCRSGYASTFTCGTISDINASGTYTSGVTVTHLIQVPGACPIGGDSGGVFIDSGNAIGITSAESRWNDGSCFAGYYAHVTDITSWLGVSVWV